MIARMTSLKALIFMIAAVSPLPAQKSGAQANGEDQHVAVALSLAQDTLRPGSDGELLVRFTPRKGYHVNAVPPVAVRFDSASPARDRGRVGIPTDTATGYLRSSEPVRRPFTLAAGAARGRAELRGVLTYYYCSDAEGWCRKENMPFALPVTVK